MKLLNTKNFLFILIALLFALVLVSFLGGNSNKEGYAGATIPDPAGVPIPVDYADSNGNVAMLSNNGTNYIITVISSNPQSYTNYTSLANTYTGGASGTLLLPFNGPNGSMAVLLNTSGVMSINTQVPPGANGGPPTSVTFNAVTSATAPTSAPTSAPTTAPTSAPTTPPPSTSQATFTGPNGNSATISDINNNSTIVVTSTSGNTVTYTLSNNNSQNINTIHDMVNMMFYGPNGGSARVFQDPKNNLAIEVTEPNGNTTIYTATTTYSYVFEPFGMGTSSGTNTKTAYDSDSEDGYHNSYKNKANKYRNMHNNQGQGSSYNKKYYNSSLPAGVPRHMIPRGQQDLYILKSEIVPPVCPTCPTSSSCPTKQKPPPCPPCARCPEPSFECKKVPNYSSNAFDSGYGSDNDSGFGPGNNGGILPEPVISSFSSFGM